MDGKSILPLFLSAFQMNKVFKTSRKKGSLAKMIRFQQRSKKQKNKQLARRDPTAHNSIMSLSCFVRECKYSCFPNFKAITLCYHLFHSRISPHQCQLQKQNFPFSLQLSSKKIFNFSDLFVMIELIHGCVTCAFLQNLLRHQHTAHLTWKKKFITSNTRNLSPLFSKGHGLQPLDPAKLSTVIGFPMQRNLGAYDGVNPGTA